MSHQPSYVACEVINFKFSFNEVKKWASTWLAGFWKIDALWRGAVLTVLYLIIKWPILATNSQSQLQKRKGFQRPPTTRLFAHVKTARWGRPLRQNYKGGRPLFCKKNWSTFVLSWKKVLHEEKIENRTSPVCRPWRHNLMKISELSDVHIRR